MGVSLQVEENGLMLVVTAVQLFTKNRFSGVNFMVCDLHPNADLLA